MLFVWGTYTVATGSLYTQGPVETAAVFGILALSAQRWARLAARQRSVRPGCLAAFELANALGYGDQISNRVVDGLGDLIGGLRLQAEGATT